MRDVRATSEIKGLRGMTCLNDLLSSGSGKLGRERGMDHEDG